MGARTHPPHLTCTVVSPSRTETTGPEKSDASTAEKEEMKKPNMDTERISSLHLK